MTLIYAVRIFLICVHQPNQRHQRANLKFIAANVVANKTSLVGE